MSKLCGKEKQARKRNIEVADDVIYNSITL